MDYTNTKPNYAELARKYKKDYRTIKKYHEGYEGKPRTRSKPSRLDIYREVIEEKLSIPRTTRKGVYEFLVDRYGGLLQEEQSFTGKIKYAWWRINTI